MEIWGTLSATKKALGKTAPVKGPEEELLGRRRTWRNIDHRGQKPWEERISGRVFVCLSPTIQRL